jgi:hypothetical protein
VRREEVLRRADAIPANPNAVLSLGLALMTASMVVAGQMSLTALGLLTAPVRLSRRFFSF